MHVLRRNVLGAALLILPTGCLARIDDNVSHIASPRIIAVRAEPAEVRAGETTHLTALLATPETTTPAVEVDWALCTARKPLSETGPVSVRCLAPEADWLTPLGTGLFVDTAVSPEACSLFGPNPPPPEPGSPPGRPVDADSTGGYFQPVRVRLQTTTPETVLALLRVSCGLSGARQQQTVEFNQQYHPNENPAFESITATVNGQEQPVEDSTIVIPTASVVTLRVRWPDCPVTAVCNDGVCSGHEDRTNCAADCTTPRGCNGSESYVAFDTITRELVYRRESMSVAWFSTGGNLASERSRTRVSDSTQTLDNTWTAPDQATSARVWLVLRDDRGGTAWKAITFAVRTM